MTKRWKPILSAFGVFCIALPQARSQLSTPQPVSEGEAPSEAISRFVLSGAAVAAANGTTRMTATLAQTAIGPTRTATISAGQGIWYPLPRTSTTSEPLPEDDARFGDPTLSIFPNPFSQSAQLSFHIPQSGRISLTLYDLLGKPLRTLLDEQVAAGTFSLNIEGEELPSGRYTVILTDGDRQQTIPLQIVR